MAINYCGKNIKKLIGGKKAMRVAATAIKQIYTLKAKKEKFVIFVVDLFTMALKSLIGYKNIFYNFI